MLIPHPEEKRLCCDFFCCFFFFFFGSVSRCACYRRVAVPRELLIFNSWMEGVQKTGSFVDTKSTLQMHSPLHRWGRERIFVELTVCEERTTFASSSEHKSTESDSVDDDERSNRGSFGAFLLWQLIRGVILSGGNGRNLFCGNSEAINCRPKETLLADIPVEGTKQLVKTWHHGLCHWQWCPKPEGRLAKATYVALCFAN